MACPVGWGTLEPMEASDDMRQPAALGADEWDLADPSAGPAWLRTRLIETYARALRFNAGLASARDDPELFEELCGTAIAGGGIALAWVGRLDRETGYVEPVASRGDTSYLRALKVTVDVGDPRSHGPTGTAFREQRVITCNDIDATSLMGPWRRVARRKGFRSSASIPLLDEHGIVAVFSVYSPEPGFFTPEEILHLQQLATNAMLVRLVRQRDADRFRLALAGSGLSAFTMDRDLRYTWMENPSLGYRSEMVVGRTDHELLPPAAAERVTALKRRVVDDGESISVEVPVDAPDRTCWYWLTAQPVYDASGSIVGLAGQSTNITERKEAELEVGRVAAALETALAHTQAAKEQHVRLLESLPEGVVAVGDDGLIIAVNRRAEELFGYDRDELLGRPLELLLPEHLRERHARERPSGDAAVHQDAMRSGRPLVGRRRDGGEFPVEVSLSVSETDNGRVISSVISDVTERRRLERHLQSAQRLEAVGRLAGGVAHDFNNLLQVIGGNSALLRGRVEPEAACLLAEVEQATDLAARLTRQLLTFSKRQPVEPRTVDANDVLRQIEPVLARLVGRDAEVVCAYAPSDATIFVDPSQLEQVVINLVVNARDAACGEGKIRMLVERRDDAGVVAISVADGGCGIDEETLAHVFEPFYTTKQEGTGLGLATVHGIVERAGGSIEVESVIGEGTTFTVLLPLTSAEQAAAPPPDAPAPATGRILVVDDEPSVRRLVAAMLEATGYETVCAETAAEARRLASGGEPFDVIVSDYTLADQNGCDLKAALRADGVETPVLLISGYVPADGCEAVRYLPKPFTPGQLARAVRAAAG